MVPSCQGSYGHVVTSSKLQRVQIGMLSSGWHDHNAVLHQHSGREMVGVWNRASRTE